MDSLAKLQDWYLSQCDDNWEHAYGVSIGTLDNPGWSIHIDLKDTSLESILFEPQRYGIGIDADPDDHNWLTCEVKDNKFVGFGGPHKLKELIDVFLAWAHANA